MREWHSVMVIISVYLSGGSSSNPTEGNSLFFFGKNDQIPFLSQVNQEECREACFGEIILIPFFWREWLNTLTWKLIASFQEVVAIYNIKMLYELNTDLKGKKKLYPYSIKSV